MPKAAGVALKVRRKLLLFSVFGILAMGLIISLIGIVPLYRSLKSSQDAALEYRANLQVQSVQQFVEHTKSVAFQITSRTKAREKLEQYNRGEVTKDALQVFLTPILEDALNKASNEIVGIARLDAKNALAVHVGADFSKELWAIPHPDSEHAKLLGPVDIESEKVLVVGAPILDRASSRTLPRSKGSARRLCWSSSISAQSGVATS